MPFQSGRYARVRKRMACIKPFRDVLYRFAWLSVQSEPWARDYYRNKRAQGKSHSVAVRALSNNWVRIIFAMWQNQKPYCRETFLQAKARHAPAA